MKSLAVLFFTAKILSAQIQVLAIATSSDFTQAIPTAGSLASIGVKGLTGITGVMQASGYPLPYSLAGVSVTVSGIPAPILAIADLGPDYGNSQQINIQVPKVLGNIALVQVSQSGQSGAMTSAPSDQWGVFFADANGRGVLQHTDYSLVTDANPARPGEVLVAYATNLTAYSAISNAPPIGVAASIDPLPRFDNPGVWSVQIQVNYQATVVFYMGLTPGLAGVFQVNFMVPTSTPPGMASLGVVEVPDCFGFGAFCPQPKNSHRVTFPVVPN
jgi:uncharacterized protein (TIGR03437 family)